MEIENNLQQLIFKYVFLVVSYKTIFQLTLKKGY